MFAPEVSRIIPNNRKPGIIVPESSEIRHENSSCGRTHGRSDARTDTLRPGHHHKTQGEWERNLGSLRGGRARSTHSSARDAPAALVRFVVIFRFRDTGKSTANLVCSSLFRVYFVICSWYTGELYGVTSTPKTPRTYHGLMSGYLIKENLS